MQTEIETDSTCVLVCPSVSYIAVGL